MTTGLSKKKLFPCLKFPPQFCLAKWPADTQPIGPDGTFLTQLSSLYFARPCKYHLVVAEVAHDDAHDGDEEVDEDEGHDHVEQVEQPDRQVPAHTLTAVKQLWNNLSVFCCVPILIGTKRGRIVILKYT